jgi:hypothetical protein
LLRLVLALHQQVKLLHLRPAEDVPTAAVDFHCSGVLDDLEQVPPHGHTLYGPLA